MFNRLYFSFYKASFTQLDIPTKSAKAFCPSTLWPEIDKRTVDEVFRKCSLHEDNNVSGWNMTKLWTSEQSQSIKKWVIKSTGDVDNEVVLEMSRYKRIRVTPNSGKKLLFINNYDFFQNAILARPFNSKIIKLQCLITFTFHFTKPRSLNSISQQSPQKPFAHYAMTWNR